LDSTDVELILFDLGGVLIELTGVGQMIEWSRPQLTADGMWEKWLASPAVRSFESGQSDPGAFACAVIDEFGLPVVPEVFLDAFIKWPKGAFPGVHRLLRRLRTSHRLGVLSNTNSLHWDRFDQEMEFMSYFDYRFASHLIGRLKPDPETFRFVSDQTGIDPKKILFLDDNQVNIDGAREAGLTAFKVYGPQGVEELFLGLTTIEADSSGDGNLHQINEV